MKYIDIDLRGAREPCTSYIIGSEGENIVEAFRARLPEKYLNCNIVFEFQMENSEKLMTKPHQWAKEIVIEMPYHLMTKGRTIVAITATDRSSKAVYRLFEKTFVVLESISNQPAGSYSADAEKRMQALENSRSDWNENNPANRGYVENRTHWKETGVTYDDYTVIFNDDRTPDGQPEGQNWEAFNLGITLTENETYFINIYGESYESKGFVYSQQGDGYNVDMVCIGNFSLYDQSYPDTGCPILIAYVYNHPAGWIYNVVITDESLFGSDLTFRIGHDGTVYHPLPSDYMPESVKDAVENKHVHGNKATLDELHCDDLETSESEISPGGMGDPYRELLAFRGQYLRRINDGGVIQGAEEVTVNGRKYIRLKIYYDPTTNLYDMIEIGQNVRPRFIDIPIVSAQDSTIIDGGVTLNGTEIDFGISVLEADSHTHTNKAVLDQLAFASIGGTSLLTYGNRLTGLPPIRNENDPFTGAITPHVIHRFGNGLANPISSLTITGLSTSNAHAGLAAEYLIEFVTGATAPTVTFPASVEWADELTVEANKHYQISILDNIALWCAVDVEAVSE